MAGSQSEFERLVFEIAGAKSTRDLDSLHDYVREAFAADPICASLKIGSAAARDWWRAQRGSSTRSATQGRARTTGRRPERGRRAFGR
jgi:hypothetical protein